MLQSQETNNSNNISKQIRSRKYTEENAIQPFKSHRKRVDQNNVLMPIPQNQHTNNESTQKYKLIRDYPAQTSNFNASECKKKSQRFKYDFNNIDHSITKEQIGSKFTSNVNAFESQALSNRYATSIKKNSKNVQNKLRMTRNEVKSILFDSKVEPFESRYMANTKEIQIQNDREIHMFKQKVDRVNNQIEAGINNLQKMIQKLKQRKISQKSNIQSKVIQSKLQVSEGINKQDQKERSFDLVRSNFAQIQIKNTKINEDKQVKSVIQQRNEQILPLKKEVRGQQVQQANPASSQMPLSGDFKSKLAKFPPQYTSLINRLAYQIQIDMQFTNTIAEFTKNGTLPKIKALILKDYKKYQSQAVIEQSFFQIQPSQVDPLQVNKPYFIVKMKQEEEADLCIKVYKKYKQLQDHFQNKLKQKFNASIIKLLFEQLAKFNSSKSIQDVKTVTIGHLLSYLNMRTNKSFRNRYFVKLAKRLQLKPNTNLNPDSFQKLITLI